MKENAQKFLFLKIFCHFLFLNEYFCKLIEYLNNLWRSKIPALKCRVRRCPANAKRDSRTNTQYHYLFKEIVS